MDERDLKYLMSHIEIKRYSTGTNYTDQKLENFISLFFLRKQLSLIQIIKHFKQWNDSHWFPYPS